jgi:hypothetical protein
VAPDFNPWANSKKNILFYPPSFSLLHYSPALFLSKTVKAFPPLSFHLSFPPWRFKDSTKGKPQDWKEKDLPRPLFTFTFEFFGFLSSSSLQRYSNLRFARSLYFVQRFEFP